MKYAPNHETSLNGLSPQFAAARENGWWTNFNNKTRPAYEHLVREYKGPWVAVIKEAVPAHVNDGSLWIEPPPEDWGAVNQAIKETGFYNIHDPLCFQ